MAAKKNGSKKGLRLGEQRSLHLTEFSQGRPNEISLNVLDNLAQEQEGKKRRRPFADGFFRSKSSFDAETSEPRRSSAGAHGSSGPARSDSRIMGVDSQNEIKRRQRSRKVMRAMTIALVSIVVAGALIAGGTYLYQEHEKRATNQSLIHAAGDSIEKTDALFADIDAFYQTAFNDDTVGAAQALVGRIPAARSELSAARSYAEQADTGLDDQSRDKEAAQRCLATIDQRLDLLDVATERLTLDAAAKQADEKLDQAQAAVAEGNSLMVQAARVVSDTTEENVNKSTEYLEQARVHFSQAQGLVTAASALYPGVDYAQRQRYLTLRIDATEFGLESNKAILLQDRQTAESFNDRYNEADRQASTLAETLGEDFSVPLAQVYADKAESLKASYESLRNDIAGNDAFLRDYLGSGDSSDE